ncbi:MAG: 1-acyl-sn-glycerol-3-phosphate acyltransferase [Proteobacteria bacterium]|nr:1-acyl-sn-glycerol-3-phosphate acyltransferase [Pseudomonadota bacterium]
MNQLKYTNSVYHTVPEKISLFARTFPELSLYGRFINIVIKASAKAKHHKYKDDDWCASSMGCLSALEKVGVNVEISGIHHMEQLDGPCVIIGNHMSLLEAIVLPTIVQPIRKVTYIVKQSLLDYPVFGHVMRSRDPIAVSRTSPRQDLTAVIDGGIKRLERGVSIIAFPQTSRMHGFDPSQFSTIGVKLAQKANVPILPLALKTDAWGNGKYLKDFGKIDPAKRVYFAFDKPIRVKGRGAEEHKAIIKFITKKLSEWKADSLG